MKRIGGTLKVVGRLYFRMGMRVPRNVAEVAAYCIEVTDYRRTELLQVLDKLVEDYQAWVLPDGRTLFRRGDTNSVGLEFTTIYGLGLMGVYLNWEDCRSPNPMADGRRGQRYRYQPVLKADGTVKVVDLKSEGMILQHPESRASKAKSTGC